jgi:hypothetical protein
MMPTKQKKAMDKFWRTYFWITIILWVFIIEAVVTGEKIWPDTATMHVKIIGAVLYPVATLGLFGYTYGKNIFCPLYWKIFFLVLLPWEIYATIICPPDPTFSAVSFCIGLVFIVPLYIAIFLYAFKNKNLTQGGSLS